MFKKRLSRTERQLEKHTGFYFTSPKVYFPYAGARYALRRTIHLLKGRELRRHTTLARGIYQKYDDIEMRLYEGGQRYTYNHGKMGVVPFKEIRHANLAPIIAEIEKLLAAAPKKKLNVLEVGCGNGTNIVILKEKFGDKVNFHGFDISPNRIEQGKKYWKTKLDGVDLKVDSALELANYADNSMDLIYTLHCLEQVPYSVGQAVSAIARVTKNKVVHVEPMYEYANAAQRIYAIWVDMCRTLLPEVEASTALKIEETYPLELLANPLNKSGVIVATKI